jgi:hypothetical protein
MLHPVFLSFLARTPDVCTMCEARREGVVLFVRGKRARGARGVRGVRGARSAMEARRGKRGKRDEMQERQGRQERQGATRCKRGKSGRVTSPAMYVTLAPLSTSARTTGRVGFIWPRAFTLRNTTCIPKEG